MNKQDYFSEFQKWRQQFNPQMPSIYNQAGKLTIKNHPVNVDEKIAAIFPTLYADNPCYVELLMSNESNEIPNSPLRIAVLLSGGQAPGGHNVISGLFDFIKKHHTNSQLFGFIGGSMGIYTNNYVEINEKFMEQYRNQGGFDMICSGRNKIETPEQFEKSLLYCSSLKLDGLVVVGGDDSNTNACFLAEYFLKNNYPIKVVGVPKTIDGDLKNEWIETSFGFDTATRIYSEMIGDLCIDALTLKKYYHFIKLMGRSASHVAMECCLSTQINWVLIGEEIEQKNQSFKEIVSDLSDIICKRSNEGKNYGVILVPEGLIEFVSEFKVLIQELNEILCMYKVESNYTVRNVVLDLLTDSSKTLFLSLPRSMADQLLLERDPHGNVQLSRIDTEKYLISQIEIELENRADQGIFKGTFSACSHFFGYEGQSALPSNFDTEYCYKLGYNAGGLISLGLNGHMSIIRGLAQSDPQKWVPAGCPLMTMMNMERRKGKDVCVIRKALLDMDDERFKYYAKVRETWALNDCYRNPGPIQYKGALSVSCSYLVKPPDHTKVNLEEFCKNKNEFPCNFLPWAPKSKTNISPLSDALMKLEILLPKLISNGDYKVKLSTFHKFSSDAVLKECESEYSNVYNNPSSKRLAEIIETSESFKLCKDETILKSTLKDLRIAIVYSGEQAPGGNNIINGLLEFKKTLKNLNVTLIGFLGGNLGMFEGKYIEINENNFAMYKNQGGFDFLGRSSDKLRSNEEMAATLNVCVNLNLDGLIMVGASHTFSDAILLSDYFLAKQIKTSVIAVPCNIAKNVCHPSLLEAVIGFDTSAKVYSHLIGNIMTDCASTPKYWYIIKLMGKEPSHLALECALQTHPNCVIISEEATFREQTIEDLVKNICDIIIKRHNENKNFGTVLIPEGVLLNLQLFKALIDEINIVIRKDGCDPHFIKKLLNDDAFLKIHLSPWNVAKFNTLPDFAKIQLLSKRDVNGNFNLSAFETEKLFAHLITEELDKMKAEQKYDGVFIPLTHSFCKEIINPITKKTKL